MFTGIGGFELAFPKDWESVGFSEIDKYAIQVYLNHYPQHVNYGDATKIDETRLPDFDLLCGGFPCQSFSVAGRRKGFEDTRGTLFFDIARIAAHKRPRYLLLENVKGLLNHDSGKTFQTILKVLTDIGYRVEWQLLNSKDFGVPQNRERVFIVGYSGDGSRPKVFPISGNYTENTGQRARAAGINNPSRGYEIRKDGLASSLRATEMGSKNFIADIRQLNQPTHSNDRIYAEDGIAPTLNTMQGGRRQPKIAIPVITPDRLVKRQNGRRFKTNGEPSFTLNTQDRHGVFDGSLRIRRLTPIEAERLQGFPDNWTAVVSDTQRYKTLGNAVTVNVVSAVSNKLNLLINK